MAREDVGMKAGERKIVKDLSPLMEKALVQIDALDGHFFGNHGIREDTLRALYDRGLVRFEQRLDRNCGFERAHAVLTDPGKAKARAIVVSGKLPKPFLKGLILGAMRGWKAS